VTRALVIPAAGQGSRLGSPVPKALTQVAGQPMIGHVIGVAAPFVSRVVVVASPAGDAPMREYLATRPERSLVVVQSSPTGMLDAIRIGLDALGDAAAVDRAWIAWCDQVLLLPDTLTRLAKAEAGHAAAFPTIPQRPPYIHFDRREDGRIVAVRQRREGDEMPEVGESDAGLFSIDARARADLTTFAVDAPRGARTGEVNFLPFLPWLAARRPVTTVPLTDPVEALGINTPEDLWAAEAELALR
jgi:bifunctional UDP-N-acetylglucosamine pyrophosphorylase/glucosamine-1-phosphate N-acetyltransferase